MLTYYKNVRHAVRFFLIPLFFLLAACGPEEDKTDTQNAPSSPYASALPPGLLVDGEPLDPFCFAMAHSMEDGLADVPVKNCESPALIKEEEFEKGPQSYGVNFSYKGEEHSMARPYMLYQFVGHDLTLPPSEAPAENPLPAIDEEFPVILYYNTGGTGNFSNLLWLRREGDTLKLVRGVAGGDRCNGGITGALIDAQGRLSYTQNLTPFDMVAGGGQANTGHNGKWDAAEGLSSCAVCCYASAHYTDGEFTGLSLNGNLKEALITPDDEGRTQQSCMDDILRTKIEAGKTSFTPEEWDNAAAQIEHTCLGRMEGE